MPLKTTPFDPADYLDDEKTMIAYLNAALADGTPGLVAAALGDIARKRGMTALAQRTGLKRETLYRSLGTEGNPELETVLKVTRSLGLTMAVAATKVAAMKIARNAATGRLVAKPRTSRSVKQPTGKRA